VRPAAVKGRVAGLPVPLREGKALDGRGAVARYWGASPFQSLSERADPRSCALAREGGGVMTPLSLKQFNDEDLNEGLRDCP
jgi:hypothetical protein